MRQQKHPPARLSLPPALWRKEGFCVGGGERRLAGLEEEGSHHGTGLSHQRLTRRVRRIPHFSRSLWKEHAAPRRRGDHGPPAAALHHPSITAQSGGLPGGKPSLPTEPQPPGSAGAVGGPRAGAMIWGRIPSGKSLSASVVACKHGKDWTPPPLHPTRTSLPTWKVWPYGAFVVVVPSEQESHQIFLNASQQKVGVERKQGTTGMLIAPF